MSDRLLIVDDDETIRQTFRSFFEGAGFAVDTAGSLPEAAGLLASTCYAAVIADVCLTSSGTEGLAIAAYVRQIHGDRPVIVLTAYGVPQVATAAAGFGVDAFLHKPVSLVWLRRLLQTRIAASRGELQDEEALAAAAG